MSYFCEEKTNPEQELDGVNPRFVSTSAFHNHENLNQPVAVLNLW